jgi:hypothetical protein
MDLSDYEELGSGPGVDLPTRHVPAINWPQAVQFLIGLAVVVAFVWWRRYG